MKTITIKKKEILQFKGDLNTKVYKVESGLLRSYTIDAKGREHIFMFAPEDWIITDHVGPDEPCELFIDALEDAVVVQIEKDSIKQMESNKFIKRMAVLQKRIILLMSAPAIDRYEHFVEMYPNMVQRVPQRMIASYLGITPEALSNAKRLRLNK